ncbi:hypothetical protein OS187_05905 [Xanthomonadaceae bacterium JHOS43]|nr:hypothetical protein [Xanthomonadaceae bacterium JHOS43]MCX7562490.1 hypothetical protein [Xanthomonadaceae bacterium XH05]
MKRFALLACTSLFALGLVACGGKEQSEPASEASVARQTSDPAKAVESFAAKLKENNVLEAVQLAIPPARLDELRNEWKQKMAKEEPSDEERAEFAEQMVKFTAPNAEEALYAELEPLLVKYETEMAAQMPMMIGMGQGFAMQSIQANEELTDAQKQQAVDVVGALAGWLQTAKFADRDLAKKGIGIVVKAARDLDVKTLEDVRALDFDHAMGKVGIVFGGLKEVLALYGFDVNQALASTKASVVSRADGQAKVAVAYSLLGKSLTTETDMIEVDDRWYGKDTIEQLVSGLAGGDDEEEPLFDEEAASE